MFLFPQNSAAMKRITFLTMLKFGAMMLLSLADQKVIPNQEKPMAVVFPDTCGFSTRDRSPLLA